MRKGVEGVSVPVGDSATEEGEGGSGDELLELELEPELRSLSNLNAYTVSPKKVISEVELKGDGLCT